GVVCLVGRRRLQVVNVVALRRPYGETAADAVPRRGGAAGGRDMGGSQVEGACLPAGAVPVATVGVALQRERGAVRIHPRAASVVGGAAGEGRGDRCGPEEASVRRSRNGGRGRGGGV